MKSEIRDLFIQNSLNSDVILEKALEFGASYLRGGWQLLGRNELFVSQMSGGQSNLIYLVTSDSKKISPDTPSCFLIRIHCQPESQVFNDTVLFSIMSERGLGPKMYGFFTGGRLEEFLPSRTLDVDCIMLPEIAERVGALLSKYHEMDVPIPKTSGAIRFMRQNLDDYIKMGGETHVMCPKSVKYEDEDIPEQLTIQQLNEEIKTFEKWASVFDDTVVFSHNDLTPLNILELNDTKDLVFIDFEYACYNWRGFDVSMFLCENAFDYRGPPPGVQVDQNIVENHPNLRRVCTAYINAVFQRKNEIPSPETRHLEIENLLEECKFFIPLVNLFWAIWSLKQHAAKHDNGHDLKVAASDRITLYYHFKPLSKEIYEKYLQKL